MKEVLASKIEICKCRVQLIIGTEVVREGLLVKRWIKRVVKESKRVVIVVSSIDSTGTNLVELRKKGHCMKCLKEAGVKAYEILRCKQVVVNPRVLREAGYSVDDIVNCFPPYQHPRRIHPPCTIYTMFDSQLKEAGFLAEDFRKANYSARDLSMNAREAEYEASNWYVGDLEWEECCAFFSASELKRAGFSLAELIRADFGPCELVEAGFAIPKPKRRRVTSEAD